MMRTIHAVPAALAAALTLAACGQGDDASAGAGGLASYATGELSDFETGDAGRALPEVAMVDADGEPETLSGALGEKATLVNLWATWCAPCIIEMPALNELQADYGPQGLEVVTINLDDEAQKGLDFFAQRQLDALAFHHDPDLLAPSVFGTASLPLTVIYDAEGVEMGRTWGAPDWVSEDGRALIEAALAQGAGQTQ